jgi:hypothetical protein
MQMMWQRGRFLMCIVGMYFFLMPAFSFAYESHLGHYRMYPGPARPLDQVSILAFTRNGAEELFLEKIDGILGPDGNTRYNVSRGQWAFKSVLEGTRFVVELLPGPHTLTFSYCINRYSSENSQTIEYVFKPGMLYSAHARTAIDPRDQSRRWKPIVIEVGSIPADFIRPSVSCESFKPSKSPMSPVGCLPPVDPDAKQTANAPRQNMRTVEYTVAGATFTIEAQDNPEIAMGELILAVAAVGLDLKKEAGRAEFLIQYAKQREKHPEISNVVIKCKQFPMP